MSSGNRCDRHAQRHHRILAQQPFLRADGHPPGRRAGRVFGTPPADRRGARPDQRAGAGDHRGAGAVAGRGRLAVVVSGLGGDERAARRRTDSLGVQVRRFGRDVVFKEGTDIYRARQLVGERLPRAAEAIPAGYGTPMLGPIATALGEVFQFQVKATKESGITPMELRTLLDWFIAYQLRRVEGVTEINAHGGEMKTYEVEPDPDELAAHRLSMTDLFTALAVQQRQCRRRIPGSRRRGAVHPRREPGSQHRGHRRDRHRRAQRRAGHRPRRGQGRDGPHDPGRPGDSRRPGRDRHRAGDDADRPERPRSRRASEGGNRRAEEDACRRA